MRLVIRSLGHFLVRLRYPLSMPEEVASDLGIVMSNSWSFQEFIGCLTNPHQRPTKLIRFMPRMEAEKIFKTALRKEHFKQNSLFSYRFKGSWMEFSLYFDEQSRLRRLYIQHKDLKQKYEVPIS